MKNFIFCSLIALISCSAFAETVTSSDIQIAPSGIDQVIRLVDKNVPGSSHKKLSIIVQDHGMSTDVSPRYSVYLGYASMAEMGNITADFLISDLTYQFLSATRKAPGIYEVKLVAFDIETSHLMEITYTIDATQIFIDEKKLWKDCTENGGFCDSNLKTSIEVKETGRKQYKF